MSKTYKRLLELIETLPVISSHEHLLPDEVQRALNLDLLFENSYLKMLDTTPGCSAEEHAYFLDKCRNNSLFVWLEKSLMRIYGLKEKINPENWEDLSVMIRKKHALPDAHLDILRNIAGYRRAIQDAYWDYASNNGHPEMLSPTMRTDMFVTSFHPEVADHDGNSPFRHFPEAPTADFGDYLSFIESLFTRWREGGAVAMKLASAYERPIQFDLVDRATAADIFLKNPAVVSPVDRKAYGDFMFHWFCELAARLEVPFQVHTGLGKLNGSDPLLLEPSIAWHRGTLFVLFHAGYPWYDTMAGLARAHSNVIVDMVWVPLLSPTGAVLALHEILEVSLSSDRICWGGDARTAEEAFGTLLAWRYVLAKVLAEKVDDGYLEVSEAETLAHKLMYRNVAKLYQIQIT
jgi:hypothetical protein